MPALTEGRWHRAGAEAVTPRMPRDNGHNLIHLVEMYLVTDSYSAVKKTRQGSL